MNRRTYTMTARADATAATRRRILDACVAEVSERHVSDVPLADVAARAGVSVQTVLRHFGSRASLVDASFEHGRAAVVEERRTPVGDVGAAVSTLVEHYERRGDTVLLMLAQERTEPLMSRITTAGRATHRTWVEEVFGPLLPPEPDARTELVDLLVVALDVYTWKLLRRDRALSRASTEQRMRHLVEALLRPAHDTRGEH